MNYSFKINNRSRGIKIKIDQNGEVIVSAPSWVDERKIAEFVSSKKEWIDQSLSKIKSIKKLIDTHQEIMIFGKKYHKVITTDKNLPLGIKIDDDQFIINQINEKVTRATADKINRFMKNTAEKYIFPRTHQIAKHMGISFERITLKEQSTRWGSCSSRGNLNFNWRLAHHPTPVIDYVIIHELAHRVHLNHSKNFWKLVEKFDSEYRIHEGWLKRKGKVW